MAITNKWNNYLILEDDMIWNNKLGLQQLDLLLNNNYDVIVLSGTFVSYNKETCKLNSCQTTGAYLVNSHYYNTLLLNFEEGLQNFILTKDYKKYAIDQYWKNIQSKDNWYVIIPSIFIQKEGYSDIEKKFVNYRSYYI